MAEAYAVIEDGRDAVPSKTKAPASLVSPFTSPMKDAPAAMELVAGGRYLFLYNNGSRGHNAVYICTTHVACPKLMRLVRGADEGDEGSVALEESGTHGRWRFALETSGKHEGDLSDVKKSGIATALKRDVDSVLSGSAGPAKCARLLKKRYKGDDIRLRLMPDEEQLKKRKAQLRRTMQGMSTQIRIGAFGNGFGKSHNNVHDFRWMGDRNPAALLEWVSGRLCESSDDFFGAPGARTFTDSVHEKMNVLIILKTFSHDVDIDGTQVKSFGIVFSSREVFSNVERSIEDQEPDGVLGVSDGTYKLQYGGWTLVNFGTYTTRYVRGGYSKHYVPWTFLFVRTEHTEAYRELLAATVRFAQRFYGLNLSIAFGSLDHAACIANAFKSTWPTVALLTCWSHAARKANEKAGLLHTDRYYENVVEIHLQILHQARTKDQFRALAGQVLQHWRRDGEDKYAGWFSDIYLSTPWDSLFMSAAGGVQGVLPSQNPLEAFHRVMKKVGVSGTKLSTAAVLNDSLPGVLDIAGKQLKGTSGSGDLPIRHFVEVKSSDENIPGVGAGLICTHCVGPLLTEYVVRARGLLSNSSNYLKLKRAGAAGDAVRVVAVVFNALEFATCVENPCKGVTVTEARMKKYIDSLNGTLVKYKPMTDARMFYQSLHRVQVLDCDHAPPEASATWSVDDIRLVRRCYVCDCSVSRQSGWMCEHIVATMVLLGKVSVDGLLTALPVRRRPRGQFKPRGALARARFNQSDVRFFGVTHLEQLFMESPASPTHWHVTKEYSVKTRGQAVDEHVPGQVDRWIENGGRYQWKVKFANGRVELMDVEELAATIAYSHSLGLRVIP